MFKILMLIVAGATLAACNSANSRVSKVSFGQSKGIVTSGNLRLVTERAKLAYPSVVCSEPSPDYAVAFGSKHSIDITPPAGTTRSTIAADAETSEFVVEGEGRAEAVLALRDGLYTACQSYANGIIGKDAYAIILSQYGNLLLGLVGKDGASAVQASGPQAALSAMTVACISGHDTTRSERPSNTLLTYGFCSKLLDGIIRRGVPSPQSGKKVGKVAVDTVKPPPKKAADEPDGSKVTTTTTTTTGTNTIVK